MTQPITFPEWGKIVNQVMPVDTNGAAQGGNYNFVNIRNYQMGGFLIRTGVHSGASEGFTMRQAKNVEGNGSKSLAFTQYFRNLVTASPDEESDLWIEEVAVSDTFDLIAQTQFFVPVRPGLLDTTNDFDSIRAQLDGDSDAATLISMLLILWGGPKGIAGDTRHIPSTAVNRMQN